MNKFIKLIFPVADNLLDGYCGAEFHGVLPPVAQSVVCDCLHEQGIARVSYNACEGVPRIIQASFMSNKPWMNVINVSRLSGTEVLNFQEQLKFMAYNFS